MPEIPEDTHCRGAPSAIPRRDCATGEWPRFVIDRASLWPLLEAVRAEGYRLIGPTIQDAAIALGDLEREEDLPIGWTDDHGPGSYALRRRADQAVFGYAVGPMSWKRYFHVPTERLWTARQGRDGLRVTPEPPAAERLALIGARACDIEGIAIQDRVLAQGEFPDPRYAARRSDVFVVAVVCSDPGGTCFCASVIEGPRVTILHDLSLTEILDDGDHRFVVEIGSEEGARVVAAAAARPATTEDERAAARVAERAAAHMGRALDAAGLRELLLDSRDHPRWDDIAARCAACGDCTDVCPTCFCTEIEDGVDASGVAERRRRWTSCFTASDGAACAASKGERYRTWLTHKLSTWVDQFGTTGCVGCGRCITSCRGGIDITAEIAALRAGTIEEP